MALLGGRPDDGARRLERVEGEARRHQLPDRGREPVARDGKRRKRPRHVHERDVAPRQAALADDDRAGDGADAPRGEDEPQIHCVAAHLVLDDERQQHLGRTHEQQIGDRRRGKGRPQPDVAAHIGETGADVTADGPAGPGGGGGAPARGGHRQ